MAELPILPLKTASLLADTMHMSPEEFGVYCRLLFVMWGNGGRLKDDDAEMAAIGGVPLKRWFQIKEKVMRPMTAIGGQVSQGRLTDTWMKVQELRRKRAQASEARWSNKRGPRPMQLDDHMDSIRNAIKTKTNNNLPSSTERGELTREELDAILPKRGTAEGSVSPDLAKNLKDRGWTQ